MFCSLERIDVAGEEKREVTEKIGEGVAAGEDMAGGGRVSRGGVLQGESQRSLLKMKVELARISLFSRRSIALVEPAERVTYLQ